MMVPNRLHRREKTWERLVGRYIGVVNDLYLGTGRYLLR